MHSFSVRFVKLLSCALPLVYGGVISAQLTTATLTGNVMDSTGAAIPAAKVSSTTCPGTGPGGSDGTVHRNALIGPSSKTVDLGLIRDFRIYRQLTFELRGESTYVFNFVNIKNPNGLIALSAAANQITSAAGMRTIQEKFSRLEIRTAVTGSPLEHAASLRDGTTMVRPPHCAVAVGHMATTLTKIAKLLRMPAIQIC